MSHIPYAVIDDDVDAAGKHPYFQTEMKTGLTAEVADQVIEHLGRKDDGKE